MHKIQLLTAIDNAETSGFSLALYASTQKIQNTFSTTIAQPYKPTNQDTSKSKVDP